MNLTALLAMVVLVSGCGNYSAESKHMQVPLGDSAVCAVSVISASALCQSQSVSVAVAVAEEERGGKHPELRPGEVFETNCAIENFGRIPYKTKRAGKIAYDSHGREFTSLGGRRYIPVFVKTEERKAVREMAREKKFPLHFWTRNTFFANATVTMAGVEGCRSDGRKIKKTFRLKREKSLGRSWENQVVVPANFCLLEVIVKPRDKKAIKFLAHKKVEESGRVNIMLSSCPLPSTFTRPRVSISQYTKIESRIWPATFQAPENIPAKYR